nr:putative RNA-directed DNA polymerase, eukaryota, reverse transcriptase zinc-binding domain protein [Tanacetum cinerariifolium]
NTTAVTPGSLCQTLRKGMGTLRILGTGMILIHCVLWSSCIHLKSLMGSQGGILVVWDTSWFTMSDSKKGDGYLADLRNWHDIDSLCLMVIVYSPQGLHDKEMIQNDLTRLIDNHNDFSIILGDFYKVISETERLGAVFDHRSASMFNDFIHSSGLCDFPMGGKRFTRMNNLVKLLANLEQCKVKALRQKAKIRWAVKGDENSYFFHDIINSRLHRSRINGLTILGEWITKPSLIKNHVYISFYDHFKQNNCSRPFFSSGLFNQLLLEDSYSLDCPFTLEEIKAVDFKVSAFIPQGCNSSFITLVPKEDDPLVVGYFRPISLISSQYKIIANILANRLSLDVSSAVRDVQMAYIKGCQIINGPLMVDEIIALAKKYGKCIISKWRTWIHSCLNLAFASVLVNGSPTKKFKIERALRQGNPLSPFLFILAVEALNVGLLEAINNNVFHGIKVGTDKIYISYLQFADDALIMGEWSHSNARNLLRILTCFHISSGLKVNFNKSKLYGISTSNVELCSFTSTIGRLASQFLFHKRLSKWKSKSLSIGGRLMLIKSILGRLGVYYFSTFKAPIKVINKLEATAIIRPLSPLSPSGLNFTWAKQREPRPGREVKELRGLVVVGFGVDEVTIIDELVGGGECWCSGGISGGVKFIGFIKPAISSSGQLDSEMTTLVLSWVMVITWLVKASSPGGSRGTNLYTISVEDMMKSSPICLLSKASKNKSWLWHRRLNHLNFGTINDLARKDLVRGLPRLKFKKDHLCSACQLGKSKKHTHKLKAENTNLEVLNTLHMDLCGLMRMQTINGKKYILVIVDDYSRFTWVKFLRSKDETPDVVIKFITQIQVGLNKIVRYVRTDNGTEFVNQTITAFYDRIGVFHQKIVPRTPQQNGVVERRNRTLVEAARTMLIFSKAPMFL